MRAYDVERRVLFDAGWMGRDPVLPDRCEAAVVPIRTVGGILFTHRCTVRACGTADGRRTCKRHAKMFARRGRLDFFPPGPDQGGRMTPEQVVQVATKYGKLLAEQGFQTVNNPFADFREGRLAHVRWMCDQIIGFAEYSVANDDRGKLEKAMRWLGFVQGVLMCYDVMTISQMKEDNA